MARVFSLRSTRARVVTISLTYRPAGAIRSPLPVGAGPVHGGRRPAGSADSPARRHKRRKDAFVTPAIGASSTGVVTSIGPIRRGAAPARSRRGGAEGMGEGVEAAGVRKVTGPCWHMPATGRARPVSAHERQSFRGARGTSAHVARLPGHAVGLPRDD